MTIYTAEQNYKRLRNKAPGDCVYISHLKETYSIRKRFSSGYIVISHTDPEYKNWVAKNRADALDVIYGLDWRK